MSLLDDADVKAFAHITGGGLTDNTPRVLTDDLAPRFDDGALALPPLFQWLQEAGGLSEAEMRRTFNCGVGGIVVCAPKAVEATLARLAASGETAHIIGDIVSAG